MSDEITLTLPWKLAMHVKTLAHYERWTNPDCPPEMHVEWQAIIDAIDRQMQAAPAEGPERAATGETLPGLDIIAHPAIPEGTIIAVTDALIERVAKAMAATDFAAPWDDLSVLLQRRYREQVSVMLAAIGGGGKGWQ